MNEITLTNGARVRVRPIPPHIRIQFHRNFQKTLPPEPKAPVRRVKMASGHYEDDIIAEDDPLWLEYQSKLEDWQKACDDLTVDANDDYNLLERDYCITEWSFDGEHWRNDVPPSWEFPEACERAGIKPCGNERVDFISIELLTTLVDLEAVRDVAEGQISDITDEEVERARAGFPSRNKRKRRTTAKKQGWLGRLALALSRGDGGG